MKRNTIIILSVLMLLAVFVGCTPQTDSPVEEVVASGLAADAMIEIAGQGLSIKLSAADMQAREQQTFTCNNIDSNGDIKEVTVTGFSLNAVLQENGMSLADIASLNLVASDGYIMSATAEEYTDGDVYVLLDYEGDALEYPRSCIPDKRAMYWVKNLIKIELVSGEAAGEVQTAVVSQIDIFREGTTAMDAEKLNNRGFEVSAYSLKAYFEKFIGALPTAPITMLAKDGFEKTETAEVFFQNYVTLESEEGEEDGLPLYFSETLSDGMRVKQLDIVVSGRNAVYFGSQISVADLFEAVGMSKTDSYSFIASDGFETNVPADAIAFGTIFMDEDEGFIRADFDGYDWGDTKGGGKVKHLVSIKAMGEASASDAAAAASEKTELAAKGSEEALLKCFVGDNKITISEADFLALPQIEKEITKTNSKGETTTGVYKGVHWTEIAKLIGVDAFSDIVVVASDDYEATITSDVLNDVDSLFALYQDGVNIQSEGDGRVWFCASENFTANNWAKFIIKIVIE